MNVSNSTQALYTSQYKISNATTTVNYTNAMEPSDNQKSDGIKQYDFTNMTRGQLRETVNNLIKNGEMSLDESSSLVFMMGPKLTESGNLIDASNEKVDAFALLKQSIAYNQSIGNSAAAFYDNNALNALERFQGKLSGINIIA